MPDTLSVVAIDPAKTCKPFLAEVMVMSPESGYKFSVLVERSCTPEADSLWKLVFDLYKVIDGKEVQIVHVSYTARTPVEAKGVQHMASGVTPQQARVLVNEVHPAAKAIEGVKKPTKKQKDKLRQSMQHVVSVGV